MVEMESMDLEARDLPSEIDYYRIQASGKVVACSAAKADVYIGEFDVQALSDKETMLHVRQTYGDHIGVMKDITFRVQSREYRTPKMLLGVIKGLPKEE